MWKEIKKERDRREDSYKVILYDELLLIRH